MKSEPLVDITIIPSKAIFKIGEPISGHIVLKLPEPFLNACLLMAFLKGKETFQYTPTKRNKHTVINENKFLSARLGVYQF
jgi:hypothetical protein